MYNQARLAGMQLSPLLELTAGTRAITNGGHREITESRLCDKGQDNALADSDPDVARLCARTS